MSTVELGFVLAGRYTQVPYFTDRVGTTEGPARLFCPPGASLASTTAAVQNYTSCRGLTSKLSTVLPPTRTRLWGGLTVMHVRRGSCVDRQNRQQFIVCYYFYHYDYCSITLVAIRQCLAFVNRKQVTKKYIVALGNISKCLYIHNIHY